MLIGYARVSTRDQKPHLQVVRYRKLAVNESLRKR